jgi:hypothetical protein
MMLAHVQRHGFLISQEVRSMLHKSEVADGLSGAGMTGAGGAIDKKSVNRLMGLCAASKQVKTVQLALSTFTGEARQVGGRGQPAPAHHQPACMLGACMLLPGMAGWLRGRGACQSMRQLGPLQAAVVSNAGATTSW